MKRTVSRVEAAIECDKERHVVLHQRPGAIINPGEVEIDRLLAEDCLAGARGRFDDRSMGARRRADDDGIDARVGERLGKVRGHACAVLVGQRLAGGGIEIDHPRELRIGTSRDIGRV